jgi:hypothetical protein
MLVHKPIVVRKPIRVDEVAIVRGSYREVLGYTIAYHTKHLHTAIAYNEAIALANFYLRFWRLQA